MPNYKIEGNIDFYESLYSSLDYDSENDNNNNDQHICEITGQLLTKHFVTLECKHTFNYDALYTEICKQKFDFQSYTADVLSKTDLKKIRDNNFDYYIKCPYCRHIQFDILPYHDDLPFQLKYGINTCDKDFRVVNTSYVPSSNHLPANYTFNLYGYQFTKGTCYKGTINSNGKNVPCYNCYATPVVAPDGTTKLYCPIHVRAEMKAFKLEVKKKAIEDKLKAKDMAKADALSAKEAKKALKEANVVKVVKNNILCSCCTAILKTGTKKGQACGQKVFVSLTVGENNNSCKRHLPKIIISHPTI